MSKIKILHISPDFDYACGVSKYITDLSRYYSSNLKYKLFFITNKGNSLERLNDLGIPIKIIKFSKGFINLFYLLPNVASLLIFCLKYKIDVIHTHHRYPELLAVITCKILGIKSVSTVHSNLRGYKYLSFNSDRIIAVSNTVADILKNYFRVPAKKIITIYNCLELKNGVSYPEAASLRVNLNLADSDKIVLYLGKIVPEKGIKVLVKAFNKLLEERGNLKLLIIGDFYKKSFEISLKKHSKGIKFLSSIKNPFPF